MTFVSSLAQGTSPDISSLTGVQGILYTSTSQTGRASEVTSVKQLAGFKNRLFVAVTDAAGHEILDVWDTRNLSRPRLVSSIDFGSYLTNGVMFTPLALAPFSEGLLLQTRTGLSIYRFQADGKLALDKALKEAGTALGLGLTQLHISGRHASMLQQVIPNSLITADNLNQIHQQVLFDLSNPERPLFLWAGYDGSSILNGDSINCSFLGNPASLSFNPTSNKLLMSIFESTRTAQHDVFWMPKLRKLFKPESLERSLKDLIQQALPATNLALLQTRGIQIFSQSNSPAETLLSSKILEHHVRTRPLKDVFAQYGISGDDPLEMALTKVVGGHLDTALENRLSQEWYAPAMQSWLGTIFAPGFDLGTPAETKAAIAAAFNAEIDEESLARYLTLHVISPLLGSPDFMKMTLGELIEILKSSPAGELIDITLQTAGGFGAVNSVLEAVRSFIDAIPGVDLPSLPACSQFPDSTEKLINLALFSWNDPGSGNSLDRNGLAWFELLKFFRYLSGEPDLAKFTAQIHQNLRAMQQSLADNLAGRLSEAFQFPGAGIDLTALQAQVSGERQAGMLIGRLLAGSVIAHFPSNNAITMNLSTRKALASLGLHVQELGYGESTVSDLLAALETRGMGQITLGNIFQRAEILPGALFQSQVEQVLRQQIQESFGLSDLDLSLKDLLQPCLNYNAGVQGIMGDWMNGLLNDLLGQGMNMPNLLIEYQNAFENRDCIARWLVVLNTIGTASTFFGGNLAAKALEFALQEGYSAAVSFGVNTMFGKIIKEVFGDFGGMTPNWLAAQLAPRKREITIIEPSPGVTSTVLNSFSWQQRIGLIVEQRFETNWFGPRTLKLVLCHPDDPAGTRQTLDLGRWQSVNSVSHHQGALFIGGSYYAPTDSFFPNGKAIIVDVEADTPRIQHLQGDAFTMLASASNITGANYNSSLALGGLNRVFLVPNPAGSLLAQFHTNRPPRIVQAPEPAETASGGSHVFSVRAIGTAPLYYQWLKDGAVIVGENRARLSIVASNTLAGGRYSIIVSNAAGVASAEASLTVLLPTALRIVKEPADTARLVGQSATFTVAVESLGTPVFQWFHQGKILKYATGSQLVLTNLTLADAGDYRVDILQGTTTLHSRTAHLQLIKSAPPSLLQVPSSQQPLGTSGVLSATAAGWGNLTYQWFKDEKPIAGGTNSTLDLGTVKTESAGKYRVEVKDAANNTSSHTFTVVLVASARLTAKLNANRRFEISIVSGIPGQSYTLQRSTNMTDWMVVQNGRFPSSGIVQYEDTAYPVLRTGAYFRLLVTP